MTLKLKQFLWIFSTAVFLGAPAQAYELDPTAPSGAHFAAVFSLAAFPTNAASDTVSVVVSVPRDTAKNGTDEPGADASYTPRSMWFRVHDGSANSWTKVNLRPEPGAWVAAGAGTTTQARYYVYPASWQKTFTGSYTGPLPQSGTWEYFFGSGVNGLLRISPIIDPWRFQDFNDRFIFLHTGSGSTEQPTGVGTIHDGFVAGWRLQNVFQGQRESTVSTEGREYLCALLINNTTMQLRDQPCSFVYSPVYSYGVASVSFYAMRTISGEYNPGLKLAYVTGENATRDPATVDPGAWQEIEFHPVIPNAAVIPSALTTDRLRYTTALDLNILGPVRFRWTRVGNGGTPAYYVALDDVRVASILPTAAHGFPGDLPTVPAYPSSKQSFVQQVQLKATYTNETGDVLFPISDPELSVSYRVKNPELNPTLDDGWVDVPLQPVVNRSLQSSVTMKSKPAALGSYTDFYFKEGAGIVGLLPGYYEFYYKGTFSGSLAINREILDQKEVIQIAMYQDNAAKTPYTLDLRPVETAYAGVEVVIPVAGNPSKRFSMVPVGDNLWRALVPLSGHDSGIALAGGKRTLAFSFEATGHYDGVAVSAETVSFSRTSDSGFAPPPLGAVCNHEGSAPAELIKVDLLENKTYLLVEFNTRTKEYLASFSVYQTFNGWESEAKVKTNFTDQEDVEDKIIHTTSFTHETGYDPAGNVIDVWLPDSGANVDKDSFDMSKLLNIKTFTTNVTSVQWGVPNPGWSAGYYQADYLKLDQTQYFNLERGLFLQGRNTGLNPLNDLVPLDGLIRLFGAGAAVRRGDQTSTLNGLGGVSFTAASAMPYDINYLAAYSDSVTDQPNCGAIAYVNVPKETDASKCGFTVSLIAGYQDLDTPFYEFRLTQRTAVVTANGSLVPMLSATLYRWAQGVPTAVSATKTSQMSLVSDSSTSYVMALAPVWTGTAPNQTRRLNARLQTVYSLYKSSDQQVILNCDMPLSADLSGSVGVHASNCGVKFTNFCIPRNVNSENLLESELSYFVKPSSSGSRWPFASRRWTIAAAGEPGHGPTITAKAPTVNLRMDIMPVESLRGGMTGTWETKESWRWSINSFAPRAITNDTVHCGSDAFVRFRVENTETIGLDLDNIVMTPWRGNDDNKQIPYQTEGFYSKGTWIEHDARSANINDQVMRFEYSRRSAGDSQVLISPFLTNGLGTVSYDYRTLNQPAKFVIQYAFSSSAINPAQSTTLDWITVRTIDYTELMTGFRSQTGISVNIRATEDDRNSGYIRLAQISSGNEDACVLIDNFSVTDAPMVTANSWTASNAKLGRDPNTHLYWGDRLNDGFFSPMLTLNTSLTGADIDYEGGYLQGTPSALISPPLSNGVGRVSFQARQDEPNPLGTKVLIQLTKTPNPQAEDAVWVDYEVADAAQSFLITNTVYTAYSMDVNEPGYYGVRLMTIITNDWTVSEDQWKHAGRVHFDQVVVTDPLLPGFRISDVTFSEIPSVAINEQNRFGTQPLEGSPVYVTAALDRILLNPKNIRLYFSYVYARPETNSVGQLSWPANTVAAQWGTEKWLTFDPAPESASASGLTVYTMELTRVRPEDYIWHSETGITGPLSRDLKPSDIVQYSVWATYTDSAGAPVDKRIYFDAYAYHRPPWYYPRDFNSDKELKAFGTAPYFWVYSCPPGEVFFNEFDLMDEYGQSSAGYAQFVELCAPAGISLKGWKLDQIDSSYEALRASSFTITNENLIASYTTKAGVDLNRGFFVLGNGPALKREGKINYVIDDSWSTSPPGGFKLYRDNGAYEQGITYSTYTNDYDTAAAKNMARDDTDRIAVASGNAWTNLVYAGSDDRIGYLSSTGIGTNDIWTTWGNTQEEFDNGTIGPTPGDINEGQVIDPYTGGLAFRVTSLLSGLGLQNSLDMPELILTVRANPDNPNSVSIAYSSAILHEIDYIRYYRVPEESQPQPGWTYITDAAGMQTFTATIADVESDIQVEAKIILSPGAGSLFSTVEPYQEQVTTNLVAVNSRQPWIGDGMGFSAALSGLYPEVTPNGTVLGCFVSYHQAEDLTGLSDWGSDKDWFRITNDLAVATSWSTNETVAVCSLVWDQESGTYLASTGIDPKSAFSAEQPVEYCGWVIIRDPVTGKNFSVRQPFDSFTLPAWYEGAEDINARAADASKVPYFYIYGTPFNSVYINEVNLGDPAIDKSYPRFIEIVYPNIRGRLGHEYSMAGWTLALTNAAGAKIDFPLSGDVSSAPNGGGPFFYVTTTVAGKPQLAGRGIAAESTFPEDSLGTGPWSVILYRPESGISEGGVVVSAGDPVAGSPLIDRTPYHPVWAGEVDAPTSIGSVGQFGETGSSTNQWQFFEGPYTTNALGVVSGSSPGYQNPGQTFPDDGLDKAIIRSTIQNLIGGVDLGGTQNGLNQALIVVTNTIPADATFVYAPADGYYIQDISVRNGSFSGGDSFLQPDDGATGTNITVHLVDYIRKHGGGGSLVEGGVANGCQIVVTFSDGPYDPDQWVRQLSIFTPDQPLGSADIQPLATEKVGVQVRVLPVVAAAEIYLTWSPVTNAVERWYTDINVSANWAMDVWLPTAGLNPNLPNTVRLVADPVVPGTFTTPDDWWIPPQPAGTAVKYVVWYRLGGAMKKLSLSKYISPSWYVPAQAADLNLRPGPTGLNHDKTPYYWVYATRQRSVWINEVNYHWLVNSVDYSAVELAMIDDNAAAVKSLKGWTITNESHTVNDSYGLNPATNTIGFALSAAPWGNNPYAATDPRLAYYVLATPGAVPLGLTQTLTRGFVGAEAEVCVLRLYRDTGALEDEVYIIRSSASRLQTASTLAVEKSMLNQLALSSCFAGEARNNNIGSLQRSSLTDRTANAWYYSSGNATWGSYNTYVDNRTGATTDIQVYPQGPLPGIAALGILSAFADSGQGSFLTTGVALNTPAVLGSAYTLNCEPAPWYTVGRVLLNNEPYRVAEERVYSAAAAQPAVEHTIEGTLDEPVTTFRVTFVPKAEAALLAGKGAVNLNDAAQMKWLQAFNLGAVLAAYEADGVSPEEKYWLSAAADRFTEVALRFEALEAPTVQNGRSLAQIGLRVNGETVPALQGDARLVLLGRASLADAHWTKIKDLEPAEASGLKQITLPENGTADAFRFFRCVLMSGEASDAL